jgi:hypothetical protein
LLSIVFFVFASSQAFVWGVAVVLLMAVGVTDVVLLMAVVLLMWCY